MILNQKTLSMQIITEKLYDLYFTGVSVADTFVIEFTSSNSISYIFSAISKFTKNFTTGTSISYSIKSLLNLSSTTISLGNSISYAIKQTLKIFPSISFGNSILYSIRENLKIIMDFSTGYSISYDMVLASVNLLSDYDPNALSTMDASTLGDLDYTVV